MANFPPPRTRRFQLVKFIYTSDNGQEFVRTQRIDKDVNGDAFLPIPDFLNSVIINNNDKDVIWGEQSNLRKSLVTYTEPSHNNGIAQITLYIPQNEPNSIFSALSQIKELLKNKFGNTNIQFCFDYNGEIRFTNSLPSTIS